MRFLLDRRFALVWTANLLQTMAFFMFLHFPGYLEDLGANEVEIGLVFGATAVASILVRPAVGQAMDRRGRRPVILVGNAINVAVLFLYLTVDTLGPWVYTVRVLHGLGVAMLFTSLFTYAADIVPADHRTHGLAFFGVSGMITLAFAGMIGDAVLAVADYTVLFWVAIGFGAAALVCSLPLPESVAGAGEAVPTGAFRAALAQPDLRPVWWVTLVFSTALTGYFAFLKVFVEDTGAGTVGGFFAAYAGSAIALRLFAGGLPDRVGQKAILFPAMAMMAGGFVVLAAAPGDAGVIAAGVLCGAGHGYTFPILYAFVVARSRERRLGSASAIFTGLFDVGTLIGGPALGLVISAAGYTGMFTAAAVWLVAGAVVFARWDRSPEAQPAPV